MRCRKPKNQVSFVMSGARRGAGAARRGGGYGIRDDADLSRSFDKMAVGPPKIRVPPLSSFVVRDKAAAGDAVVIGEAVPEARSIPDNFPSTTEYLKAMQAHTQLEFEAALEEGAIASDRLKESGYLPVTSKVNPDKPGEGLCFFVDGSRSQIKGDEREGPNFQEDPWSLYAIQFEGFVSPSLAMTCDCGPRNDQAYIVVAVTRGHEHSSTPRASKELSSRVRSLGYVGTFFREYASAAALLRSGARTPLLRAVTAPSDWGSVCGGTYVSAPSAFDTRSVPVNASQKAAVARLTGGLDIIVGPPGTGKSTTVWHIINSRVRPDARVLVTCTRNQAVDAVTRKVACFGVLVFGNKKRIGSFAAKHTIEGRMENEMELVFWRKVVRQTSEASTDIHRMVDDLSKYPGLGKLQALRFHSCSLPSARPTREEKKAIVRGRAAGRWLLALESVLHQNRESLFKGLYRWKSFADAAAEHARRVLKHLELLIRYRIYTQTRVLLSTIDSSERMVRALKKGADKAAAGLKAPRVTGAWKGAIDTAIMDEAACVLETAVPVLLGLGVKNLTLIGDQHQLRPFSHVRDDGSVRNHSRSLMERAISAGATQHFLATQYRMHPHICEIISRAFYGNRLTTSEETARARTSTRPCKWVHVDGQELRHDARGYSNPTEAARVLVEARGALRRFGPNVDVRVITFYNMQKGELEKAFKVHDDLKEVSIVSVDACQGSDADVVIVSTVRSGWVTSRLSGFMLEPQRINVALSRAKQECIIVDDMQTLRSGGGPVWRAVVDHYCSGHAAGSTKW